jgi:S-DNA-T family DNA segregation ATPase FtsK/SpoIIIE
MAKKKPAASAEQLPLWPRLELSMRDPRVQQVMALCVALFGLLLTLALARIPSAFAPTDWLADVTRRLFGLGAFVVALAILIGGFWALRAMLHLNFAVPWRRVVGAEILLVAGLALLHLPASDPRGVAERGEGGGLIGWALSSSLVGMAGWWPAIGLLGLLIAIGLFLAFAIDVHAIGNWFAARGASFPASAAADTGSAPAPAAPRRERKRPAAKDKERKTVAPAAPARPGPLTGKRLRRDKRLPALDLFHTRSKMEIDKELMAERAHIIENTLDSFGIPVKVVEMRQGPTVTQFGLEPGFVERRMPDGTKKNVKVKVSRIAALNNDLALALAASPIRIEAPVPGKPVVGVEVPNQKSSMVALRSVLEADSYRKYDKPLKFALGHDVAGTPIFADLAAMPHVLIAGATGSGKSVCINAIIASFLSNNTPDDLRFLMIDPKMVELVQYNGIPHLLHPVVTDLDRASGALHWAMNEMDKRYRLFKEAGARNVDAYNKKLGEGEEKLPYVVVVIDELADLMMTAPEDIEKTICRLAQMSRATGIHLILATQRPSVDVVTGLIKANFPARISFAVTTQTDSRVILDSGGAEKLLGRGDMLYMAPDSPKLQRLQGCFVSDDELRALVQHWRDVAIEEQLDSAPIDLPQAADADGNGGKEKSDELLADAIALVRQYDRASTSFLQRRMGIGYNRAARLIDLMESQGIIGPAKEGGLAREVLIKSDDEELEPGDDEYEEEDESEE